MTVHNPVTVLQVDSSTNTPTPQLSISGAALVNLRTIGAGIMPEQNLINLGSQSGAANQDLNVLTGGIGTVLLMFVGKVVAPGSTVTVNAWADTNLTIAGGAIAPQIKLADNTIPAAAAITPPASGATPPTAAYIFKNWCAPGMNIHKSDATDDWQVYVFGTSR